MIKVEISEETMYALFRDILLQDYRGMTSNIAKLEARLDNLKDYEREDLENNQSWRSALATTMKYYFTKDEYEKILDETATG